MLARRAAEGLRGMFCHAANGGVTVRLGHAMGGGVTKGVRFGNKVDEELTLKY